MSLRETKKQKTAQEFMEAIKRIVDKQPTHKELKKKLAEGKPLKLNPTNVEKEAGKGYNSTKHHQTVLDEIERINTLESDQKKASAYNTKKQKADVKAKNKEIERLESEIKTKNAEIETLKRVNLSLHAHCRELTSALYDKIPQEEREGLFEKSVGTSNDNNIIPFKN
jgi:predicted transcriptional regulator